MNEHMLTVMQRRRELLARIAIQRGQMAEVEAHLQSPLALADRGMAVMRYLRLHPLLVAGLIAIIVIRPRSSAAGLMWGAWRVWKDYREFISISDKLSLLD
jgi:hypothetical protein